MSFVYKNKSNTNYMDNFINCIEFKKDIDVLNNKIICLEYDSKSEDLKLEVHNLKKKIKNLKNKIKN